VFLEDETGRHWPIRYRDLARPAITLWEQKAAVKNLRARGRCLVDEQSIFEAVAARRVVVAQAVAKTNSARREAERRVHLRSVGRAGGRAAAASSRTARRTRTPVTRRWCRCPRRRIWAASRNGRE
jgi:putative transposase